jgi:hypothetical protein
MSLLVKLNQLPSGVYEAGANAHISPYPLAGHCEDDVGATRWALLCELPGGGRRRYSNFRSPELALDFYQKYILKDTKPSPVDEAWIPIRRVGDAQ